VKDEGYLPVAYYEGQYLSSSGTNSGRDLFFESGKVIVFFDLVEHIRKGNDYIMKVALMVFADMSVVTPAGLTSTVQRLDEDLLIGFEQFATYNGGFTVKSTTFDIDKVLERYSGTVKKNALTRNMSDSNGGSNFCAIKIVMEKAYDPLADQNNLPEIANNPVDVTKIFFIKTTPNPALVINVGNGVEVYQEYAPGDTLTVTRVDNDEPYLPGFNVNYITYNNFPDTLADIIDGNSTGIYDRTGQGVPTGLLDGDFVAISWTDII
jgi:hypothetical protein